MRGANCRHLFIEIIEHEPDQEFVAISHVWSHGLGNGVSNSLPLCQIQRVFDLVSEIPKGPVLFWLDTLCVPREPFGLRRLAIEQIKPVYEAATKILVLDEELVNSEYFENTYEESLMRINLSRWAGRLWTLHEATRSRHIYCRFSNGNIKQERLIERWHNDRPDAEGSISKYFNVTGKRAISILANISQLREEENGHFQMARLWTLLRWRVTSWAEDETICMANMLNVCDDVVNDLLRTSPEIRMSRFLALFDVYPTALLFMSGPKINEDGLRWAPTSWLIRSNNENEQKEPEASGQGMARLGKAGLIISCDSLLLNFGVKALCQRGRVSFLLATDTRSLCVVRRYNKTDDSVTIQLMQSKTIAICLDRPLGIFLQERQCKGALVAVRRVEKTRGVTISFSRFLCNVFIVCILHENSRQALGEMSSELDDYSGDIVSPELAGDSRLWCIG